MFQLCKSTAVAVIALGFGIGGQVVRAQETIRIDGSSTVYPVTEAVAEEYAKEKGAARVTVSQSGTGGGFKKFVRGEIDISDASRPILAKEIADAKSGGVEFIELPIAYDALTVVINPQNDWAKTLTVAELKKIWSPEAQGKVMSWKDVRAGFPDVPLKLFGPGTDSGTFDYFTEAVNGKAKASRSDFTASEDDSVLVTGVAGDKGALGYFGYAYYADNKDKLQAVGVDNGKGPVGPSEKTVNDGTYTPLSRPIFIYVSKKSLATKPEVRKFVDFYLGSAPDLTKKVKYVPLPDELYEKGMARVAAGQTGSIFGGVADTNIHAAELFTRPLKN